MNASRPANQQRRRFEMTSKSEAAVREKFHAVDQTREYLGPGTGTDGDCWAACVASVLGIGVAAVPQFGHPEDEENPVWFREFQEWLAPRGFVALNVDTTVRSGKSFPLTTYGAAGPLLGIVSGRSPRGEWDHATVWKFTPDGGARMLHDPHKSRGGLATITDTTFIIALATPAPAVDEIKPGAECFGNGHAGCEKCLHDPSVDEVEAARRDALEDAAVFAHQAEDHYDSLGGEEYGEWIAKGIRAMKDA